MANRYWVGGSGTWDATSTVRWSATSGGPSGASVPTAADAVIIDGASGSPTITLSGTNLPCASITTTGATCTITSTGTRTISGDITLSATTTWSATGTITLNASSTITSNGVTISGSITFNAIGGTCQLGSALTLGTGRVFNLTNGTLNLNNFTLTTPTFTSNNVNSRGLSFGTGNITITGGINQIVRGENLTVTGTPTVNLSDPTATGKNLSYRGFTESTAFNFNVTTGTGGINLTLGQYKSLIFTGYTGTLTLSTAANPITLYGNLTFSAGMSVTPGTAPIIFDNNLDTATYTSAGKTIYDLSKTGSNFLTLSGATTISNAFTFSAGRLQLPASTTTSIGTFTTSGTSLKYLTSTVSGTQATISSATNATVTYLYIKDSNATGGAAWNALDPTNVNGGNNTGWSIVSVVSNGNFLLAF